MSLTVWRHFIASERSSDCEAYLRFYLGYSGDAPLTQVCERYMRASELPACSLTLVEGRVRVDRPPAWTRGLDPWASNGSAENRSKVRAKRRSEA